MNISQLWEQTKTQAPFSMDLLDKDLQSCVDKGDDVFDHYGEKPPFTIVEYRGSRLLVIESLEHEKRAIARSVINATGGYGTGILGGDIAVLETSLIEGIKRCPAATDEYASVERMKLVNLLKNKIAAHTKTTSDSWEITFTSTGTEAMDFAFQIVQLEGYDLSTGNHSRAERNVVLSCRGCWHGWGLNPNQLIDRRQFTDGLPRLSGWEVHYHQYGNIGQLRELFSKHAGKIRAIFVEGILGDGGIVPGSEQWWDELLDLAKRENARVVDDEILTGLRTGCFLAIPQNRAPDCITLGKALGFGLFPLSAVAWKKGSLSPRPGIGVRTFNARPLQAHVAREGLAYIDRLNLFERSNRIGKQFLDHCKVLPIEYPKVYKDVRGQGFMIGIELSDALRKNGRLVRDELIRQGTLAELESGITSFAVPREQRINQTIRLTPPLTTPEEEFTEIFDSLCRVGKLLSVSKTPKPETIHVPS